MSPKVTSLLFSLALLLRVHAQYRLPQTILPINYDLRLHPDIDENIFEGEVSIQIDITPAYFDDLVGNFDVSFNFYPSPVTDFHSIVLSVSGINNAEFDFLEPLITNDTHQIATAVFNETKADIQALVIPGNTFTLYIEYTGPIRGGNDLAGWYKSIYQYGEVVVTNLVTQFQATDARSVFPCFDEPGFKATFDLTLIAPVDAIKLSNEEIDSELPFADGECAWMSPQGERKTDCVAVTFKQTPVMSTYLLAFVIGGYLSVDETDDNDNPKQTVYYPYIFQENRAQFALDESVEILHLFESSDGLDIDFTESGLDKLDSVAVNDFAAGGMENWGLIIYRTARLLVDPQISSQASKSAQTLLIAHELSHQWFGNLVSPEWWDELWLSEAFATYMAYWAGNMVQPAYTLNENKIQAITSVMFDDASVFTPAVKPAITGDPMEILATFNSITYQKGMGVLNTMANVMGNDDFLVASHKYLEDRKFDTANSQQLGEIFDEEHSDISLVMDSFISQEGFPLISVNTVVGEETLTVTINQQRFVKQGPDFYTAYDPQDPDWPPFIPEAMVASFAAQLWQVPMLWRNAHGEPIEIDGTDDNIMTSRSLTSEISRNSGVEFYLVNPVDGDPDEPNQALFNFFRVQYDDFSLQLLVDNWLSIGSQNQLVIISDRFALMQASYIPPESYLDFVRNVVKQMFDDLSPGELPEYGIFNVLINSFIYIDDVYCEFVFESDTADNKALRGYFREFASDIVRRVLVLVVDDIKKPFRIDHEDCPENSDCNMLKSAALKALVRFMDADILYAAYELFYACANRVCDNQALCYGCDEPLIEDGRLTFVSEDVLQALIAGVLAYDLRNLATLNDIIALYSLVNIEQQTYILSALGAVYEDPNNILVSKALEFIMSETVRDNMRVNALVSMKMCTARQPLWTFISTPDAEGNIPFDNLFENSGLFSQEPLSSLADGFASRERYSYVETFFNEAESERINAGTQRIVLQTKENIFTRYLWKENTQKSMETYMRTFIVDKYKDDMEIWQIIMVTVGCCVALLLLVVAFWAISRPSESDRFTYYLSLKRDKRAKKNTGSLSHGAGGALTTSLAESMDRSLKPRTLGDGGQTDIVEEKEKQSVVKVEKQSYGATN